MATDPRDLAPLQDEAAPHGDEAAETPVLAKAAGTSTRSEDITALACAAKQSFCVGLGRSVSTGLG